VTAPRDTLTLLLDVVERDRDERCRDIRRQAERQARDIVATARREARERVSAAASELRRGRALRVEEARAALTTRDRRRQQAASRVLLDEAWVALPGALLVSWRDDTERRDWLAALLARAADALPLGSWRIEHPLDWDEAERARFAAEVVRLTGSEPTFVPQHALGTGVRIVVDTASLDATTTGLLADASAVEGLLLAEMWREVEVEP
jgi:hypothetical protein